MRVAVLGGGVAGSTAALHLAYEGLDATVFAPDYGQLSGSAKVENYAGFNGPGHFLVEGIRSQARERGAKFRSVAVDEVAKRDGKFCLYVDNGDDSRTEYNGFDGVIVATGVKPTRLPCPTAIRLEKAGRNVQVGTPYGLENCAKVLVVGGGNGALQAAVYLIQRGVQVEIVASRPIEETASAAMVKEVSRIPIRLGTRAKNVLSRWDEDQELCAGLLLSDEQAVEADGIAMFLGSVPFVPKGIDRMDGAVYVQSDGSLRNESKMYAVGDCRYGAAPRAQSAAGDAARAVMYLIRELSQEV